MTYQKCAVIHNRIIKILGMHILSTDAPFLAGTTKCHIITMFAKLEQIQPYLVQNFFFSFQDGTLSPSPLVQFRWRPLGDSPHLMLTYGIKGKGTLAENSWRPWGKWIIVIASGNTNYTVYVCMTRKGAENWRMGYFWAITSEDLFEMSKREDSSKKQIIWSWVGA